MNKFDLTEKLKEELKRRNLWEQDDDQDDDQDEDNSQDNSKVHIFHLGTKSYAEHKALQGYYEGVDALTDGLIESYQGKYGLLTNYKSYKNQSYKNKNQVLKYFTGLLNTIEEKRDCCDDSYIQNQIDTVQELIYSTMYKLKFLN